MDWGWGLLNCNALLHPEIQVTRNGGGIQRNEVSKHSTMTPAELNLTEGVSGTLTTQIVEFITREDARNGTKGNEGAMKRREPA